MRKCVLVLLLTFLCCRSDAQGWKFDMHVNDLQEKMANCVVKLDIKKDVGNWSGTGVLFHVCDPKDFCRQIQTVLTARHLVENAESVEMTLQFRKGDTEVPLVKERICYTKDRLLVFCHPDNTVDLCAIIISPVVNGHSSKKETLLCSLDSTVLADEALYAKERPLDPVVMVGYPPGLVDDVNLQPIFRRGVYATNPSLDYKGEKVLLLDIPNNGGSSGSPIFHFDDKLYKQRETHGVGVVMGSRLALVGISFDGVSSANGGGYAMPITGPSNNTAWVIKTARIKELFAAMVSTYMK